MRTVSLSTLLLLGLVMAAACGGGSDNGGGPMPQCSDGQDNDGDGLIDFPDDPGCTSVNDDSEDSAPSAQCSDGRDNDGDGKIDFPYDPGCFAANQDSETDDCPDGPNCPQCSNGKDDDNNGIIDFPNDPGCLSASDTDEFTDNTVACGANTPLKMLPLDGHIMGTLDLGGPSTLSSPTCGGGGAEDVYELRIASPKVVTATTNNPATSATLDTVLYVRSADCTDAASELACNDDAMGVTATHNSSLAVSISQPGVYYLVVDAHDSGTGGAYDLQVNFLAGEGEPCDPNAVTCGTGLVCRIPLGGAQNVCSKPMCSDGVDDDGDGKNDFPTDPGCTSPDDNDETDSCPGAGPGCPQCGDGVDNDSDGLTDYPNDPNCTSAATSSESCVDTDVVPTITGTTTSGTTVGSHNDSHQACGSSTTTTAGEVTYRFHAPMKLDTLSITTTPASGFDAVTAVYGPSCGGTALACEDTSPIQLTNVAAGDTYIVVDGWSSGTGAFTLGITGTIHNNESCESPLVTAGVLRCGATATCSGTAGSKKCMPAACSDGVDNNGDGKIDYPEDPGCDSPTDATEDTVCPGANCPVCSDGMDNDTDGHADYATDLSCWAASGTSESFCNGVDTDRALHIGSYETRGTTVGMHSDFSTETCQSSAGGNDVAIAITLPVPVTSIQFDTVDPGTSFDTIMSLRDATCGAATQILCNDDTSSPFSTRSTIVAPNLAAGTYSLILDGYGTSSGTFVLHTHGVVANGTACTSPLFASGVLSCTSPATCTAGHCQ